MSCYERAVASGRAARAWTLGVLVALLCSVPAAAQADVLAAKGKRGRSAVPTGHCKYGNTGLRGFLTTSVRPPVVTGANLRRRRRNDRTSVRYAVYLVDATNGHRTLEVSNWSGWLRVREATRATWSGTTSFTYDWSGNYRVDLRVEWWKAGRRVGWRAHRVTSYQFFDQYNAGPYGPISSCHHFQVEL
jgi:hypothetical protein